MAFVQRIQPEEACKKRHGNCHVIDCITTEAVCREDGSVIHPAGTVVWHSHMDAAIHPEHRLNPHHPAEDHRTGASVRVAATKLCGDCEKHPSAQGHFGL